MAIAGDRRTGELSDDVGLTGVPSIVAAGLALGAGMGFFWAFIFAEPLLGLDVIFEHALGPPLFMVTMLGSWFGGGAAFGLVAAGCIGSRRGRTALAAGGAFLVASFLGTLAAMMVENVAVEQGRVGRELLPLAFTVAFTPYLTGLVLAVTLTVGRIAAVPGGWRAAVRAALVTGAVFIVLSLALNLLPGLRVGGGDRAMVKVALIANTVAATIGGMAGLHYLTARLAVQRRMRGLR